MIVLCSIVGAFVVLGLIAVAFVFLPAVGRDAQSASIVQVLNAHRAAAQEFAMERQDRAALIPAFDRFKSSIHSIDFSRCPDDFRVAYQNYLNAFDVFSTEIHADTKVGNLLVEGLVRFYAGGQRDGGAIGAMDRLRAKADDLVSALNAVKTSAVAHGVKLGS
jgi:hypothetical protein